MKDFKQWWNEADIFAGEGAMEAAEQAWDAAKSTDSALYCGSDSMNYVYILWVREDGGNWCIYGYTKDGQGAITWAGNASKGVHRKYERVNEKAV